jgi:uncharacterized OsmC-like protein
MVALAETATPTLRVRSSAGAGAASEHTLRDLAPLKLDAGQAAPSPLELLLASLNGCTAILAAMVAHEQGFRYEGLDLDAAGEVDYRGLMGEPGVRPYFQAVRQTVWVRTDEPETRIAALQAEVERRCPVSTLLRAAGVDLESSWRRQGG